MGLQKRGRWTQANEAMNDPYLVKRPSLAWRLKVIGLTTIGVSAFLFAYLAVAHHSIGPAIPALVIGAFGLVGWRVPGVVGFLLILFAPIGAFLVLLGSTNLDPASQVILGLVWWAGLPIVSGVLLVAATVFERREWSRDG
jgi:hypothetical protein